MKRSQRVVRPFGSRRSLSRHGLLADALASQEAFEKAIPHYRAFVKARPQDVNAWTGLGVASALTGRNDDAVAAFRAASQRRQTPAA